LTIAPQSGSGSVASVGMNGWWVVPAHNHVKSAAVGWRVEVADEKDSKGCLGGSCAVLRLAAAAAAVTTWSGHLHFALGTRPPVEIRNERWLFDLRVRH
jgi:hypothetical protein